MNDLNISPDPDRIEVCIDTTLMEPTEVRIIESHLRAIQAVVDGAKPQGVEPPKWRSRVEEWGSNPQRSFRTPLSCVLRLLSRIDNDTRIDHDPSVAAPALLDDLARIVAVCEQEVGDGWRADVIIPRPSTAYELARWLTDDSPLPTEHCWKSLGNAAAAWLAHLAGEAA